MYKFRIKIILGFIIAIFYFQIFAQSFGAEQKYYGNNFPMINSSWIFDRSMSSVRQSIILNPMMRYGESYSVQNLDFFVADANNDKVKNYEAYDTKASGFIFTTTSQFARTENSAWITGVGYGYVRSAVDYDGLSSTEYGNSTGLNVFLGYNKNNYLVHGIISSAYSDMYGVTKNNYNSENIETALELGKIFVFSQNFYAFPYANIDYKKILLGGYELEGISYPKVIDESSYYNLGFLFMADWKKFFIKLSANYSEAINMAVASRTYTLPNYPLDSEKIYSYLVSVGYYFWDDILLTLENNGKYGDFYSSQFYGLKVRYTF
ncbi:MAG: autotransporter domain-containing protein [Fusobacteriaceae bacterium]